MEGLERIVLAHPFFAGLEAELGQVIIRLRAQSSLRIRASICATKATQRTSSF